jgi:hypothetical protein
MDKSKPNNLIRRSQMNLKMRYKNPKAYRIPVRAYLDLGGGPGQIVLKDVRKTTQTVG